VRAPSRSARPPRLRIGLPTAPPLTLSAVPEIEPRVDEAKVRLLLAEGHESAQLDYKASCNPRERRELVAITKDIWAMNVLGGYIVIGADDGGQPTGQVTAQDAQAFDQANLQGKLRRTLHTREVAGSKPAARIIRKVPRCGPFVVMGSVQSIGPLSIATLAGAAPHASKRQRGDRAGSRNVAEVDGSVGVLSQSSLGE
jgi:hypothetical protein